MPLAATHIIASVSFLDYFGSKYFENDTNTKYFVFYAAVGSLLPDIDIPLGWLSRSIGLGFGHGTITHTPFFALLFLSVSVLSAIARKKYISQIFFIFFFGITIHLVSDYVLGGGAKEGIVWFYPLDNTVYKIHFLFFLPYDNTFESLDAIVLLYYFYRKSPKLFRN